jgi:hypothetical protein
VVSVSANISDPAIPKIARRVAREESYEPALLRRIVTESLQSAQRLCNSRSCANCSFRTLEQRRAGFDPDLRQADPDIANIDQMSKALPGCAPTDSIG